MIPENLYYTKEHEWAKVDGENVTIGITDFAQEQLGEVTFIELPKTGLSLKQDAMVAAIESTKAASDVYSPVTGDVTEINQALEDQPELLNDDPYEGGWVCKMVCTDPGSIENLMDAKAYDEYLKGM